MHAIHQPQDETSMTKWERKYACTHREETDRLVQYTMVMREALSI